MRADGLHDVARADYWARRPAEPIGDRGQPVLFAAMDMYNVSLHDCGAEPPDVAEIRTRSEPPRERECHDAIDALGADASDHPLLGAVSAAERDLVTAPRELARDARGPVGVGRPAAAGEEVKDSHLCGRL